MAGHALPPADPLDHAWVVEYRPLDRCFPPECKIKTRNVHGYATSTMEDGDPGAYVAQGPNYQTELFFERGVLLRPGESFAFDLPEAAHASELDVMLAAARGKAEYDAAITVSSQPAVGPSVALAPEVHVQGTTAAFVLDKKATEVGRFERYGKHLRLPLPSRAHRPLRVSIVNRGNSKLAIGSPLVMKRVEGRGPRQAVVVVHDATLFHEAAAFLKTGTGDAKADWVRNAVADRGIYFPDGQSPGQGTQFFSLRFFTGAYYENAWGWPGMYGKGFDETLPLVLPGPVARMAEQGFVTAFYGDNFLILPTFGNVGWDVGYNSERNDHPASMAYLVERWAEERPRDDSLIVWWNATTHAPHSPGRKGSAPPMPPLLPAPEVYMSAVNGTWRNLLAGADWLKRGYDALAKGAPRASRVMWIGADHSSAASTKMASRVFRGPGSSIGTGLLHACGGTSDEANTPFAIVYDDPRVPPHPPHPPAPRATAGPAGRVAEGRTSSLVAWQAFEGFLGIDLGLPRSSGFVSPALPSTRPPPIWDDRFDVSVGCSSVLRASVGDLSYALFDSKITQATAWSLKSEEQLVLVGGPTRSGGIMSEELYDDRVDPYEYQNVAGARFEDTLRMRREMTDWLAAHWEVHTHPRHRNKLVFSDTVDVDLFAPRPFTALVGDVAVASTDRRLAHVHGKEVVVLEDTDPIGIVELRGAAGPLVLKCSGNGLPLDVLTSDHPRFNLEVARLNCPLPEGPHDVAGPGEVLFSFEPAVARPVSAAPGVMNASGPVENDELLAGMKRWGYVRDIDEKKKKH